MRLDLYHDLECHLAACVRCNATELCIRGLQLKDRGDRRAVEIRRGACQRARTVIGYVSAGESK